MSALRRLLAEWPLILALVLLWLCLWGSVAPLTVVTGLVTAVVVTRLFELPPLPVTHRLHPVAALSLLARLAADVAIASVQVAGLAVAAVVTRRPPPTAIVRVPLGARDELLTALTALALSLVPGSIVVEVGPDALVLHVLGVRGPAGADEARRSVQALERRIVRALEPRADPRAVAR